MNERTAMDLQEMLERELDEIAAKGELSNAGLDKIDKITRSLEKMNKLNQGGYSGRDYYDSGMGYQRSYNNGANSYNDPYNRAGYADRTRRGGYSGHDGRERMIQKLEDMMNQDGLTAVDREAIQGALNRLR